MTLTPEVDAHPLWVENLRRHATLGELRRSPFFAEWGGRIERFLSTPQVVPLPGAAPRLGSFLRVASWNVEKGRRFEEVARLLEADPVLRWADVILLNEADRGMNRSGNRHVARDLARRLGMHMVFAPAHFELTKGAGEDLDLQGENREGLQGNAILSRYPIEEARTVMLPVSFEPYEFHEKRFGRRNCVWARLRLGERALWAGTTHLELRNTPACRAAAIRCILERLPGAGEEAYLLGGDLNTNTFGRGTAWRTLKAASRLLLLPPSRVARQLLHPESGREPLFAELRRGGFEWEGFNAPGETARAPVGSLEETRVLPRPLRRRLLGRLDAYGGYLGLKLDWLLGKNVRGLRAGQARDRAAGVESADPGCRAATHTGPDRLSDHLPVYADLDLA